ncbi:N terminal domain [Trypanosoma vivax]|nr:N terminal domain [Trypanosoma vivax]
MRTGKGPSEGQAFHRRLLSEYNTDITLDNYVSYFQLKPIAKEVEQLRKDITQILRDKGEELRQFDFNDKAGVSQPPLSPLVSGHSPRSVANTLEQLRERREILEKKYFSELQASFVKVKNYQKHLEDDLMSVVEEIKRLSEEEIRSKPEDLIPKLYVKAQTILRYRALNLAALRKILKKFLNRCARDSIELQERIYAVDDVISRSAIAQPQLDIRRVSLDLIALYGTVFRLTYEGTVDRLARYEHKAGVNIRRILPHSETFFFALRLPYQEKSGDFAVRILPGNTSVFGVKMICEVLRCEQYPPCCGRFPNGEVKVDFPRAIRGDDVFIMQSLVQCDRAGLSHSGTLMELALMLHTARISAAARITAIIPYMSYTGSVSSMAAVAEILEKMGCQHVITVDMAREQVEGMFSVPMEAISARYEFVRFIGNHLSAEGHDFRNITVVAPNEAAVNRAKNFADALMVYMKLCPNEQFVSLCTAVERQVCPNKPEKISSLPLNSCKAANTLAYELALRQQEEGACSIRTQCNADITPDCVVLVGDVKDRLCIIFDTHIEEAIDICRTASKLREEGANRIIVMATHFTASAGAVERLTNSPIDLIVVTDSLDHDEVLKNPRIAHRLRVLPIAPLLAHAIEKVHTENSLTTLFEK